MGDHSRSRSSDHGELVASLFATRVPAVIITLLFIMTGIIVARATADPLLGVLMVCGMVANIIRLFIMTVDKHAISRIATSPAASRATERRFAMSYLAFAAILGAFCARAMAVAPVEYLMLIGILMSGYAAGVAAGVTLRPYIAIPAICLAVLPTAIVAAMRLDVVGVVTAVTVLGFIGGGFRSMQMRYRSETGRIALRQTYEQLARQDHLTRIANRLGLEQRYVDDAAEMPGVRVVVHYLDLDGFKQVNDQHGHLVGDGLLVAVAARLANEGSEAIAARLGGDEFVLVQRGAAAGTDPHVAREALERRLSLPYAIDGVALEVGVSIGTVAGSIDQPLHELLREGDWAQRLRKLERRRQNHAAPGLHADDRDRGRARGGTSLP